MTKRLALPNAIKMIICDGCAAPELFEMEVVHQVMFVIPPVHL